MVTKITKKKTDIESVKGGNASLLPDDSAPIDTSMCAEGNVPVVAIKRPRNKARIVLSDDYNKVDRSVSIVAHIQGLAAEMGCTPESLVTRLVSESPTFRAYMHEQWRKS